MTRYNWTQPQTDEIIQLYISGDSPTDIGRLFGVGRTAIRSLLQRHKIELRGQSLAQHIAAQHRTPAERQARIAAAHEAVRGRKAPLAELEKRAATIEMVGTPGSPEEAQLVEWLADLDPTPQWAVGPYNCDIGLGPVAVEVWTGNFHLYGDHAKVTGERFQYLFDRNIFIIVVWIQTRSGGLFRAAANQIHAWYDAACRNPSLRSQYRVIGGDGEPVHFARRYLDNLGLDQTACCGPHAGC